MMRCVPRDSNVLHTSPILYVAQLHHLHLGELLPQ